MINYLLILFFMIFAVLCVLPQHYWEACLYKVRRIKGLHLISSSGNAKRLIEQMQFKVGHQDLPEYKFYTTLIYELISCHRKYGLNIAPLMNSLREGVYKDHQFERQLVSQKNQNLGQFFAVSVISWVFVWASKSILELPINSTLFIMMLLWQILGAVLFMLWFRRKKIRFFRYYPQYFKSFYLFKGLYQLGLPLTLLSKKAELEKLWHHESRPFIVINDQLKKLLKVYQQQGVDINDELNNIIDELWFHIQWDFQKFLRQITAAKFFFLPIFYLSVHLLYLFLLFGRSFGQSL